MIHFILESVLECYHTVTGYEACGACCITV
jgi:hypothetical protein